MTTEQKTTLVEWFRDILKAFENFFHQIQLWFDTDIKTADWYKELTATTAAAAEETTV